MATDGSYVDIHW